MALLVGTEIDVSLAPYYGGRAKVAGVTRITPESETYQRVRITVAAIDMTSTSRLGAQYSTKAVPAGTEFDMYLYEFEIRPMLADGLLRYTYPV
jgi:hypothetical protein